MMVEAQGSGVRGTFSLWQEFRISGYWIGILEIVYKAIVWWLQPECDQGSRPFTECLLSLAL